MRRLLFLLFFCGLASAALARGFMWAGGGIPPTGPAPATPVSVMFSPSAPQISDASLAGTQVATISVAMSDGSTYAGSSPVFCTSGCGNNYGNGGGLFALTGPANPQITLGQNLSAVNDGTYNSTVQVSQNNVSKFADVQVQVISASCPTPSPPSQAVAANLTLLGYNADFNCPSYATKGSVGYTNNGNGWFWNNGSDGSDDSRQHEIWLTPSVHNSQNNSVPGSAIVPAVTDGAIKVLQVNWNSAWCLPASNPCGNAAGATPTAVTTISNFNTTESGSSVTIYGPTLPNSSYLEVCFRISQSPPPGNTGAFDLAGVASYHAFQNGLSNGVELDQAIIESFGSPTVIGGINNWGNGENPMNFIWRTDYSDLATNYHCWGTLVTSDGSTGIACLYNDNILQNNLVGGRCQNELLTAAELITQRVWTFQCGDTTANWSCDVRSIRWWTRAGCTGFQNTTGTPNSQQCNGPLYNP